MLDVQLAPHSSLVGEQVVYRVVRIRGEKSLQFIQEDLGVFE